MAKKNRKFKTEVQQLLDLVIHSLYSKKEIFLRELISNASDAIDRARFEALTDKSVDVAEDGGRIELVPDKEAGTLTVRDNGIGMSMEELETNIGTIANSGTRRYLESLQGQGEGDPGAEFIGQFGVGFYASFMVADRVDLVTRRAGAEGKAALHWSSKGEGSYTVQDVEREEPGTDVIIHLAEDQKEYLDDWRLRTIVTHYSNYISYPIVLITEPAAGDEEKEGEEDEAAEPAEPAEEVLNAQKAIWKKAKAEVSDEEYAEFFKHVSHDMSDPLRTIHFAAEGTTEFRALLYIPSQAPWDLHLREERRGIHLYVKNVFITDDCRPLLPDYLRFVRGVVDSSDLPLNVSREMLQDDVVIRRIRKSLVGRILKELAGLLEKEREQYETFYSAFGLVFKEGLTMDFENAEKLKDLLLFRSSAMEGDARTTLREYVDRMPEGQPEIYFLTGDSPQMVRSAPHLEVFRDKGYEVLFMVDPIDEWVTQRLTEYDEKHLHDIGRGTVDLGDEDEQKARQERQAERAAENEDLLAFMSERLKDHVKEVRLSNRLRDSASCLVVDEAGMTPHMERIMKAMNQDVPESKRILEVNGDHPVMARLKDLYDADKESGKAGDYVELLHALALLTEGSPVLDPARVNKLVTELMVAAG